MKPQEPAVTLSSSEMKSIEEKLNAEANSFGIRYTVVKHIGEARMSRVTWSSDGITVSVAKEFPFHPIKPVICARVASMGRWMSEVRLSRPDTNGAFDLSMGDIPTHSSLAFSGNGTGHVLIPDCDFMQTEGYREFREAQFLPWLERDPVVFWRGSLTGHSVRYPSADWRLIPRARLCLKAQQIGRGDVLDVGVTGQLTQIFDADWRAEIYKSGIVREATSPKELALYRTTIDIDGNSSAWAGLFTKLLMGLTVIKIDSERGFRQWYYDRLTPWVHFIPVSSDLIDLESAINWVRAHPARAESIANAGREVALSMTYKAAVEEAANTIEGWIKARPPSLLTVLDRV